VAEQKPQPKCLHDLISAKAEGEDVDKQRYHVFSRETDLLRTAIERPMAFASSDVLPAYFHAKWHRALWEAIDKAKVTNPSGPLDLNTLASELRNVDAIEFSGPAANMWLQDLYAYPGAISVEHAIEVLVPEIIGRFKMRTWGSIMEQLIERGEKETNVIALYQAWLTESYEISRASDGGKTGIPMNTLVSDITPAKKSRIVPTGFPEIDLNCGGGMGRGDLMVVGGGTGHGKSFLLQRMMRILAGVDRRCLYISAEDSAELMKCRMLADFSEKPVGYPVSPKAIRVTLNGQAGGADPGIIAAASQAAAIEMGDRALVVAAPKPTISEVCAIIRRHKYVYDVDTVMVDYLQAVQPDEMGTSANLTQTTAANVAAMKRCAKECDVALVLATQYSRESYKDGEEPGLNAAKWAGDIENESEIIFWLWRTDDNVLHAKLAKLKWGSVNNLRYIIDTHMDTGCLMDWREDDEPPPARKSGGRGR